MTDFSRPNLLKSFRDRYPTGGLCAELLLYQDGVYAVRATVTVDGNPIFSGMAAAANLAEAEDQARDRALSLLALEDEFRDKSRSAVDPSAGPDTASTTASQPSPAPPENLSEDLPSVLSTDTVADSTPAPNSTDPISPALSPEEPAPASWELPGSVDPAIKAAAIAQLPDMSGGPVDLSDILAQTDVELRRVNWDVYKGREHLERTYGKRSRHELTDEELLSFLLYLETLPDAAGSTVEY